MAYSRTTQGLILGTIGVIAFSATLPATRLAVPFMGSTFVGLGRALIAAALALIILWLRREPIPKRDTWLSFAIVSLGVIIGFPLFSAMALQQLPAAHSAVVIALLPAATAVMGVLRAGERAPLAFWLSCGLGVVAVLIFASVEGAGQPQAADLLLVLAVLSAAVGYAEGARLSREMGGWRVICWALVFTAPFLIIPVLLSMPDVDFSTIPTSAWLGFAYVSCISMFLAFFAWYGGLALGGVARVSQLQLLQPILTLIWSALFVGEHIKTETFLASILVIASVGATQAVWRGYKKEAPPEPASAVALTR